jgi:hypothetical protein
VTDTLEEIPAPPLEPPWVKLSDQELLALRLCDLGLKVAGSEVEPRVEQLYKELDQRGLPLKPQCYLGDEWFSPEGVPAIAIPFYLAHPRLKTLELRQMLEVEGGTAQSCMMLLRHECGHTYDHAYKFSEQKSWLKLFGNPNREYSPETYRPRPYSRSFVHHLPNWYAQAHPDEDFAETFAVWLGSTKEEWQEKYKGSRALKKLEYVDELMRDAASRPFTGRKGRLLWNVSKLKKTLDKHYAARKKLFAEDFPDFFDYDLRAIISKGEPSGQPAAVLLNSKRKQLREAIVRWTGQRKYTVDQLVQRFIERCKLLQLPAPKDETRLFLELGSYLSALVTNHLHTGRFKRSV